MNHTPGMTDEQLEQAIAAKPAAKVTAAAMQERIAKTHFWTPEGTTLTVCVIQLDNGFTTVGEAACASPANFDPEIGKELAYKQAFNKLWPLFGFLLTEKQHDIRNGANIA